LLFLFCRVGVTFFSIFTLRYQIIYKKYKNKSF
jgi:hypothetical protein